MLVQSTSEILLSIANGWADQNIYGNRRGRQPASLWKRIIQAVEHAYSANEPVCGITADIEKAFNCLPRWPIMAAATFVGTPFKTLTAWAGALGSMVRHFRIRESFSAGFQTSTGLAEGCALSCYGMMILDHIWQITGRP